VALQASQERQASRPSGCNRYRLNAIADAYAATPEQLDFHRNTINEDASNHHAKGSTGYV
jgi:hypothetical protein